MKTLMTVVLSSVLASAAAVADVEIGDESESSCTTWRQLAMGSSVVVQGVHAHAKMAWKNTQHKIYLANGDVVGQRWFKENLGSQFRVTELTERKIKVRYNVVKPGLPSIQRIEVTLRDAEGHFLCKSSYRVSGV